MQKADPPGPARGLPPADFRRRSLARAIDTGVALLPIFLVPRGHPHAGEVLFAALLLYGDSLFGAGRSLGKRVSGLRVVKLATHRPAGMRDSVLRNLPFALAVLPAVLGASRPIFALALACILAVEALVTLRPLTRDLGQRRLGDLLAGTQVIDTRIALGLDTNPAVKPARVSAPLASRAARRKDSAACALR
ncbi:MAG TPA: RDD family protein [Myxococcales bacterium]|nr:RDD family protein [Myxococcales bacterium]